MPVRKAIPGRPISAKWLNDIAIDAEKNRLARSNLVDGSTSDGGTGTRPADYNPLLIFKVTGTTTGGYTFVEQTDPNADGTYTDADSGLSSTGTGLVLVAPAAMALATNDLVLARRNPLYTEKYEVLSALRVPTSGGATLDYQNTSLGSDTNLSGSTGVFTDILSITAAVAGKYLICSNFTTAFKADTAGSYINPILSIGGSMISSIVCNYVYDTANLLKYESGCFSFFNTIITISAGTVVKLQAARVYTGTVTTAQILGGGAFPCDLSIIRVAP